MNRALTPMDVCLALVDPRAPESLDGFRLLAKEALKNTADHDGEIGVSSLVAAHNGVPLVRLTLGHFAGDLSLGEARAHALLILECAEAAETDSFLFEWVTKEFNAPEMAAAGLIDRFRKARALRREKENR